MGVQIGLKNFFVVIREMNFWLLRIKNSTVSSVSRLVGVVVVTVRCAFYIDIFQFENKPDTFLMMLMKNSRSLPVWRKNAAEPFVTA